ncbi:MAG: hypothetical protein ACFNVK_12540, partial [Prevotella sp.]
EEGWFGKLSPLSRLTLRASYSLTGTPPDASYSNSTAIIKASNPFRLQSSFGLLIALQQISLRRGCILTTSV